MQAMCRWLESRSVIALSAEDPLLDKLECSIWGHTCVIHSTLYILEVVSKHDQTTRRPDCKPTSRPSQRLVERLMIGRFHRLLWYMDPRL